VAELDSTDTAQPPCEEGTLAHVPPAVQEKPSSHSSLLAHATRQVPRRGSHAYGEHACRAPLAARETDAVSQVSLGTLHALSTHRADATQSTSEAHEALQAPLSLQANGAQSEPQQIAFVHSWEAHSDPSPHACPAFHRQRAFASHVLAPVHVSGSSALRTDRQPVPFASQRPHGPHVTLQHTPTSQRDVSQSASDAHVPPTVE
jgi:hypothetical protein